MKLEPNKFYIFRKSGKIEDTHWEGLLSTFSYNNYLYGVDFCKKAYKDINIVTIPSLGTYKFLEVTLSEIAIIPDMSSNIKSAMLRSMVAKESHGIYISQYREYYQDPYFVTVDCERTNKIVEWKGIFIVATLMDKIYCIHLDQRKRKIVKHGPIANFTGNYLNFKYAVITDVMVEQVADTRDFTRLDFK